MDGINELELDEYLKQNLSIEIDMESTKIKVTLFLKGQQFSYDYINLKS